MGTAFSTEHRKHFTDDEFLALVWADEELLRSEFDAIIAASWARPQARRPWPASRGGPLADGQRPREPHGTPVPPAKALPPGIDPLSRQRSPPGCRRQNSARRKVGDRLT